MFFSSAFVFTYCVIYCVQSPSLFSTASLLNVIPQGLYSLQWCIIQYMVEQIKSRCYSVCWQPGDFLHVPALVQMWKEHLTVTRPDDQVYSGPEENKHVAQVQAWFTLTSGFAQTHTRVEEEFHKDLWLRILPFGCLDLWDQFFG